MGQSLDVKKRGNLYYLRKSPENPFIEIRRVRECMKAVGSLLAVSQVLDQHEGIVVKETTYADRYLVD
jgi:hypothetical protein